MTSEAQLLIDKFEMQKHPEGGYFKETYRADENILKASLPDRFNGRRSFCTAIYFLLEGNQFSAFHRIKSDELWHFYAGQPLNVYVIEPAGAFHILRLGNRPDAGETFQAVVKAGSWFASAPAQPDSFSFLGCTVSPGFDFADFELANANDLVALYPEYEMVIRKYCR